MLLQFAFPFLLESPTNKVGDTWFPCPGNFALVHGGAPSHFDSPAPSSRTHQNLDCPSRTASEKFGAPESDLAGVVPKPVWRSDFLVPLASGEAAVSSLEDRQVQLGCNADPAKSRQSQFEEISFSGDLVIENATALPQIASICTHEVVRNGLFSPAVNTKSEPGIACSVDQSDTHIRTEESFDITSVEAQTIHCGFLGERDTIAHKPIWKSEVLDLLAYGGVLATTSHDQQGPPQHGAESTKSTKAQPEEINLGEARMIKSASENLHCDCPSTKKFPYSFNFVDRSPGQSQWLGSHSATNNLAGLPVLRGSHSKNYTSKRIPKATDSTPKVVRNRVSLPPKNTKLEPGIGSSVNQSDARICVEQSFDFNLIEALPAQFGVIDGLYAMASETNSRRHFSEFRAAFDASTPLLSRLTRSDSPSISPAKCRSTVPESAQSDMQNADGYPTNPPLGWSDSQTNHMPLGHPDEVPRANFVANATTISAQSRAKAGCPAHLQQTQTPNKTTP